MEKRTTEKGIGNFVGIIVVLAIIIAIVFYIREQNQSPMDKASNEISDMGDNIRNSVEDGVDAVQDGAENLSNSIDDTYNDMRN